MKKLKLVGLCCLMVAALFVVTGCGNKNIEGKLEDIMEKLYAEVPEDNRPMGLTNMEINDENIESFIGTDDVDYVEAIASESMVGSIAHSVVLLRVKDVSKVEEYKKEILEDVNPRKWVCVGVEKEEVIVESKGDLIMVVIVADKDNREKIAKAFDNLK